jgi:hypothetical protein
VIPTRVFPRIWSWDEPRQVVGAQVRQIREIEERRLVRRTRLRSFSEPAERFLQLGGEHLMPAREGRMQDVFESCSSHRIFHGILLVERGDHGVHSAAQENRSPEKVAARFESSVGLRDSLLVDPFQKNSRDAITARREERRKVTRPFRASGLTSADDWPDFPKRGQVLAGEVKKMVWIPKEPGSNIPGHWAEAGSKEAASHNSQVLNADEMRDVMNRNNPSMIDPKDPRNAPGTVGPR